MIKLTKGVEPRILLERKEKWTEDLLKAVEDGDTISVKRITKRYNHADVKTALKEETKGKCAYCEANVTDVSHGDIEHVTPKSLHRERTFEWENLTFACQICNQSKLDKEGLVDPYNHDPIDHLFFLGPFAKGRSDMGTRTVIGLNLNRTSLIESRNREIERYADKLQTIFLVEDEDTRDLLIRSLWEELHSSRQEFIAACRTAVEQHKDSA